MPRRTSYSEEKQTSTRAREVPSPPKTVSPSSSDQEEKGEDDSSDASFDEEEQVKELIIPKKSLFGLFLLTIAIGGAQIVASVLSA